MLRGALSLRLALPAIMTSLIATTVSWLVLPDVVTYSIPDYPAPLSIAIWAMLAGPIAGIVAVGYVRAIAWADHHKPKGWQRLLAPTVALGGLGVVSIWFPQLLGNGKDISELVFLGQAPFATLLPLLLLKPLATFLCLGSGAPGGLFTPSLALGVLLAACSGMPGRGVGRAFRPGNSGSSAPRPFSPPRLRGRSRPSF